VEECGLFEEREEDPASTKRTVFQSDQDAEKAEACEEIQQEVEVNKVHLL